jgi:hypothetical protein
MIVDVFAFAVAPHHVLSVEGDEHPTLSDVPLGEGFPESDAVGHDGPACDLAQPCRRQRVEAGLAEPVMDVVSTEPLRNEPHGVACGQGGLRDVRELVCDLRRRIASTDDDHPSPRVRSRVAVACDVRELSGERVLAGKRRAGGVRERSARGHDARRLQNHPVLREDEERLAVSLDRFHAGAALDLDVKVSGVALEIVRHLIAAGVVIGGGREGQAGHRAVRRRREGTKAVVVVRPRSGRTIARFQDHASHAQLTEGSGRREPRLTGPHHDHGGTGGVPPVRDHFHRRLTRIDTYR